MAKTRLDMNTLINSNLGTQVGTITAAEHRDVETQMLEYVSGQILAAGSTANFDAPTYDITVSLGITLPNTNYIIIGHLVSNSTNQDFDNDAIWDIRSKTQTLFTFNLLEWNGVYQQVSLNWIAVATPSSFAVTA